MFKSVLLANAAATLYMTGVIWTVQLVHYPLFDGVGEPGFARYEMRHTRLMTAVVMPAMLIELSTAIALVGLCWRSSFPAAPIDAWMCWTGLILVMLIWGVTFCLSVPQHATLARGFDPHAHRLLVATNWIRTAGWTLRGGLVIWMLSRGLRGAGP